MKKKHVVCFIGGEGSAIVAVETVRTFGKENVILLNHDINPRFENKDIKRFKKEVAEYLGLEITYANCKDELIPSEIKNQFEVCIEKGSFVNPANRQILCTFVLKTKPFYKWLKYAEKWTKCDSENPISEKIEYIIYYGFDDNEFKRVDRRKTILNDKGYDSDFPIALWGEGKFKMLKSWYESNEINFESICLTEGFEDKSSYKRTIDKIEEIGIIKPNTYSTFKHANCIGCLKAGKQHWYVVYCVDYEVFQMGKDAEEIIGFSFGKEFLKDIEPKFKRMKEAGIPANENIPSHIFWKSANRYLKQTTQDLFPCECFV